MISTIVAYWRDRYAEPFKRVAKFGQFATIEDYADSAMNYESVLINPSYDIGKLPLEQFRDGDNNSQK